MSAPGTFELLWQQDATALALVRAGDGSLSAGDLRVGVADRGPGARTARGGASGRPPRAAPPRRRAARARARRLGPRRLRGRGARAPLRRRRARPPVPRRGRRDVERVLGRDARRLRHGAADPARRRAPAGGRGRVRRRPRGDRPRPLPRPRRPDRARPAAGRARPPRPPARPPDRNRALPRGAHRRRDRPAAERRLPRARAPPLGLDPRRALAPLGGVVAARPAARRAPAGPRRPALAPRRRRPDREPPRLAARGRR